MDELVGKTFASVILQDYFAQSIHFVKYFRFKVIFELERKKNIANKETQNKYAIKRLLMNSSYYSL